MNFSKPRLKKPASLAEGGIPSVRCWFATQKLSAWTQSTRPTRQRHSSRRNELPGERGTVESGVYQRCTLYSTLSPCPMCTGAALLYKIPRIIVGENKTFHGPEEYLRTQGVKVEVLQNAECIQLMRDFIATNPELWDEDIGV